MSLNPRCLFEHYDLKMYLKNKIQCTTFDDKAIRSIDKLLKCFNIVIVVCAYDIE